MDAAAHAFELSVQREMSACLRGLDVGLGLLPMPIHVRVVDPWVLIRAVVWWRRVLVKRLRAWVGDLEVFAQHAHDAIRHRMAPLTPR